MDKEQPQAKTEAPVDTAEPVFHDNSNKSTPTGLIVCMVLLVLIAIGGVGFGVWQMMQGQNKDAQIADLKTQVANCANAGDDSTENVTVACPDGTSTEIVKNVITNDLAQTLINPYLESFGYLNNLLDYSFDDDAKIIVAFQNINPYETHSHDGENGFELYKVYYNSLNDKYKEMFGSSKSLEKKDYDAGHSISFSYSDDNGEYYDVLPFYGGGAGEAMFSVVKSANYDDGSIIVQVYHDLVSICFEEDTNDGYCIDAGGLQNAVVNSVDQYNMSDLISEFADDIPIYTMTFVKDDGHYVLSNVQKQ